MESLKKWIALLATITILLLSLMSGIISAAPAVEKEKPEKNRPVAEDGRWTKPPGEEEVVPEEEPPTEDPKKSKKTPEPVTVPVGEQLTDAPASTFQPVDSTPPVVITDVIPRTNVIPVLFDPWQSGNAEFECAEAGCNATCAYKVDAAAPNGSYQAGGGNTITISGSDTYTFNWSSVYPVSCVIVKGGTGANVFYYGASYGDSGLYAPFNTNTPSQDDTYQISHVTFCFNCPVTGSICGIKWEDVNGDGDGDVVVAGITIQLFVLGDTSGVPLRTTTTGVDGKYCFNNLPLGDYLVKEVLGSGWYAVDPASGERIVHLGTNGITNSGILCCPPGPPQETADFVNARCGGVTGLKYKDLNADGVLDPGEPPWAGITIQLRQGAEVKYTTTTDANGRFTFSGVLPGTYDVVEVLGAGIYTKLSTIISGVVVTSGNTTCLDSKPFLNYELGGVTGLKYKDLNANGVLDPGEPPWAGITIQLRQGAEVKYTTTTDANGRFTFSGVLPGTYDVVEVLGAGIFSKVLTIIPGVKVPSGETVCLDRTPFLNYELGSISGYKYTDLNADGVLDDGEPGFAGVTIRLLTQDEPPVEVDSTVTDIDGKFVFSGVEPGTYDIEEVLDAGVYTKHVTIITDIVVISGEETVLDEAELGQYFLNYELGGVTGLKYKDLNANGVLDPGEPPWAGITIQLRQGAEVKYTTTTDANGRFTFSGVLPGTYDVVEVLGAGIYTKLSTIISGVVVTSENTTCLDKMPFLNYELGSISGYKYEDLNADGELDGEPGFEGVTINLKQGDTVVDTTETGADGKFAFSGVTPGTYDIEEVLDSGVYTKYNLIVSGVVVVSGEETVLNEQEGEYFLNYELGSISGFKYEDLDADGVLDPGEPGFEDVTINLKQGATVVDTTETGADGKFAFSGVTPGTYDIEEVLGSGVYTNYNLIITGVVVVSGEETVLNEQEGEYFLNYELGSISGLKYNDVNANGLLDEGIDTPWDGSGIPITVMLYKDGVQIDSDVIDSADGKYGFSDLEPGVYEVSEIIPEGKDIKTKADTTLEVTVVSGKNTEMDQVFLNYIEAAAPVIIVPPVQPAPQQLPQTGMNMLPLVLAAGVLMLLGLIALMLGLIRFRMTS